MSENNLKWEEDYLDKNDFNTLAGQKGCVL